MRRDDDKQMRFGRYSSADLQSAVSPICNRPGVGLAETARDFAKPCGLEIRDTAECNSAVQSLACRVVTQIFNLLYRRIAFGKARDWQQQPRISPPLADSKSAIQQNAILRYALLLLCWTALTSPAAVVHETYSAYHHISVIDQAGLRILSFNGSQETRMSLVNPLAGHFDYTEFFQMPLVFNPKLTNVLMVGLGGGSVQRAYQYYHPTVQVTTVEIDPAVVLIAKRYFEVLESPTLRIHVGDGRMFLRRSPVKYDAIIMDAYQMGRYGSQPPHHLVTQEFFQLAHTNLTTNGVLAYNVIGTAYGWQASVVGAMYRTMKTVFPRVYWFPAAQSQNVVLLATKSAEPMTAAKLKLNLDAFARAQHLFPLGFPAKLNVFHTNVPPGAATAPIYQDKFAPPGVAQ
jgi:spermidine synthase